MTQMFRLSLILVALVLSSVPNVRADDFADGTTAFEQRDYATALGLWRPLAEQGDARAQAALGSMYERGLHVPQDDEEAMRWYRMAAEHGVPMVQYNLGVKYAMGRGVTRDYVLAYMWFSIASSQFQSSETEYRHEGSAIQYRDRATAFRDHVAAMMTSEDITRAERLVSEWLASHPD